MALHPVLTCYLFRGARCLCLQEAEVSASGIHWQHSYIGVNELQEAAGDIKMHALPGSFLCLLQPPAAH